MDFVKTQAEFFGLDHKLLELCFQQLAALRGCAWPALGNESAPPRVDFNQSFGDKLHNHFVSRVGVNL